MSEAAERIVVLFDGGCALCHGAVRFIAKRDRAERIRFAALGSVAAARVLSGRGVEPTGLPDSMVVVSEEGVHAKSEAALRIARGLGWPWRMAGIVRVVPRGLRDAVYDAVARRRMGWFGKSGSICPADPPGRREVGERLLPDGEVMTR
ncbi:MAG: DUF393 domain-containing protein [Phycisphaerae bacterium]|nr:DUF393 domain-containing protein [Phycisphaerae bacterium]